MRSIAIVVLVAAQAALAQIEPVEIVGAQRPPDSRTVAADEVGRPPIAVLAGFVVALAAAGSAGWWTWRRWSGVDDAERAFLMLCLRRGVRHKERRHLRQRAEALGVSPVAALLVADR